MTYEEALKRKSELDQEFIDYCIKHDLDQIEDLTDILSRLPKHINNRNQILWKGMSIHKVDEQKMFAYPPGLLSASQIPEEAYLTKDEINSNDFTIRSIKDDYLW